MSDSRTARPLLRRATPTPTRARSRSAAVRSLVSLLAALLLGAGLLVSGCGSSDPAETVTPSATVVATDPEALANAVIDEWSAAMQALVTLLEDKPEASAVQAEVQSLKESVIQSLVALGSQRETLSDSDKARVDSLEWSAMQALSDQAWYADYNTLWSYYSDADLEFANLVAGFNVLMQYSDFALLQQQLPEEAARLGVE